MTETEIIEQNEDNWKVKTLVVGAVLGALLGLGAAYLLVQNAENENGKVSVSTGDGIKLGITTFGLLRQITQLGEEG